MDPYNLESEEVVALSDAYYRLIYWKALSPPFEEMYCSNLGGTEISPGQGDHCALQSVYINLECNDDGN